MPTGFLVNSICYETAPEAVDAFFSTFPVASYQYPADLLIHYVVRYEFVAGSWLRNFYGERPAGSWLMQSTVAVPPVFPSCLAPSESFSAGLVFGAAFILSLLVAWGFVIAVRLLK